MYEAVITADPSFSQVRNARGQTRKSDRGGRYKGSEKDFRSE